MKKVLTAMVLGAAIIGGSAMAMAADGTTQKTIPVTVTVASYSVMDVTGDTSLLLPISGPTAVEDTTTLSIRTNADIDLNAEPKFFGNLAGNKLNSVVKYNISSALQSLTKDFIPDNTNQKLFSLQANDYTFTFKASTDFTTVKWYELPADTAGTTANVIFTITFPGA